MLNTSGDIMERVTFYIDGFNLFYGLRSKGWQRYYWLDVCSLAQNLLHPGQTLIAVRYFTARVLPDPDDLGKPDRQNIYLEALETLSSLTIHNGYFLPTPAYCPSCGQSSQTYKEKMTDVNIAVEIISDAYENRFDTAVIISGDSDLSRPITAVTRRFPDKRVIAAFPPNRVSKRLRQIATASFTIGQDKLRRSQLPENLVSKNGFPLRRPSTWR